MIFQNASVFLKGKFESLDVRISNGIIAEIAPHIHGEPALDCTGKYLLPGAVDIHSHGCMGYDFSSASPAQINQMLQYYASHGITSVAATTMTMPKDQYKTAVKNIHEVMNAPDDSGARILGINMEGPFLGKEKKGAHDEKYLIPIDQKFLDELEQLSSNHILILDLDPELDGAIDFIRTESKSKIVSLAHTSCDYDTALQAFDAGANHITHLFNAMNGLHHRNPGIIGALCDRNFYAELISDGIHIHPAVVRMMFSLCPEKIVLISDSMSACGLSDGNYMLGGLPVTVKDGKATLTDGTIAGSTTNVFDGMKHAIEFGVKMEDAILSATQNPAKSIRMDDQIGSIAVGKRADLVLTAPDFSICSVYCGGIQI
jgi:N-acetylglucosamine-6-phosphate deacetylase